MNRKTLEQRLFLLILLDSSLFFSVGVVLILMRINSVVTLIYLLFLFPMFEFLLGIKSPELHVKFSALISTWRLNGR